MELAIRLVVVLMVVVTVGALLVLFSRNVLTKAQNNLDNWASDPGNENSIIKVSTITDSALLGLAETCVDKNFGETFGETICFGVFADDFSININSLNNADLGNDFVLKINEVPSTGAMIVFDPLGEVRIE